MFLYEVPEGMNMEWLRAVEGFVSVQKGSMKAITKKLLVAKPVQRRLIFPQDEIQVVLSVTDAPIDGPPDAVLDGRVIGLTLALSEGSGLDEVDRALETSPGIAIGTATGGWAWRVQARPCSLSTSTLAGGRSSEVQQHERRRMTWSQAWAWAWIWQIWFWPRG